jgi:hypothetical protein
MTNCKPFAFCHLPFDFPLSARCQPIRRPPCAKLPYPLKAFQMADGKWFCDLTNGKL